MSDSFAARGGGGNLSAEVPDRDNPDRLTLRLSPEARNTLKEIAALRGGVSFAEVVRRALGTELYLIKAEREGSRILLEKKDGTVRELILR